MFSSWLFRKINRLCLRAVTLLVYCCLGVLRPLNDKTGEVWGGHGPQKYEPEAVPAGGLSVRHRA
jgi:hypothetical protein